MLLGSPGRQLLWPLKVPHIVQPDVNTNQGQPFSTS